MGPDALTDRLLVAEMLSLVLLGSLLGDQLCAAAAAATVDPDELCW